MRRFDEWVRAVGEDPDPRFTLANERTFLSWMTTSLGLLGVGLAAGTVLDSGSGWLSLIAALWILLSAVLAVRALVRWFRLERAMRLGQGLPVSASIPVVALLLGVLALLTGAVVLGSL
jgi:putative membrane protein